MRLFFPRVAQRYPDHVKAKDTAGQDKQRLEKYAYPISVTS